MVGFFLLPEFALFFCTTMVNKISYCFNMQKRLLPTLLINIP